MYNTITVNTDVDIDVEEALNQMHDSVLIEELQHRGFYVLEDENIKESLLTDEEKDYICKVMLEIPHNDIVAKEIYEKLRKR